MTKLWRASPVSWQPNCPFNRVTADLWQRNRLRADSMAEQPAVALPGAAAGPAGNAAEPTVGVEDAAGGEPATAGGAPPAAAKTTKTKKQSTLQLKSPAGVAPPAAAVVQPSLAARADLARTALPAAKIPRAGSPSKISTEWIKEGKTARTKSTKELAEVFASGPPLEHYKGEGLRANVPKHELRCTDLRFMFVLKDGKARRATEAGKGVLCGWCF